MSREKEYLLDILESARIAVEHADGKKQEDFVKDILCQDAVIRRFSIIGEAARRISKEERKHYPQLPWQDMVGMRNIMVHEYDAVDPEIIWETIQNDLPMLITALEEITKTSK